MTSSMSINSCGEEVPQDCNHVENLLDTLLSFQQRSLFCDTVMLTSSGGTVFAHSAVLAAVCPGLLTSLNQKPFMLHQPNIIDFAQYDSPLIEKLVVFFYTGRLCPTEAGRLIEILDTLGVAFKVIDMNAETAFKANEVIEDTLEINHDLEGGNIRATSQVDLNETVDYDDFYLSTSVTESRDISSAEEFPSNDANEPSDLVRSCDDYDAATVSTESIVRTDELGDSTRTKRKYTKRKLTVKPAARYANVKQLREPNKCTEVTDEDSALLNEQILAALAGGDGFAKVDSSVLHDVEANGQYGCSMCDASFMRENALNRHKFTHYRTEDGQYQCNMCPKLVKLKDTLTRHLRWHDEMDMGIMQPPKPLGGSVDSKKFKPHECPICSHRFVTPSRLKAHLNTHSDARPHMCDQCGNRYNDSNELTKHKRRHRGDQRYACEVCGRKFYTSKLRSIHVKTHTGEKPYQCSDCGARFTQMPSLKCHMLVHTGELPFHCHLCPKSFRRPTRLKLHILNAHTVHSERPFVCKLCGRGFSLRGYLAQHQEMHDGTKRGKKRKPIDVGVEDGGGEVMTVDCTETFENVFIISTDDVTVKYDVEEG